MGLNRDFNPTRGVIVHSTVGNSTVIDMRDYSAAMIVTDGDWTSATVSAWTDTAGGSPVPIYDKNHNAVSFTVGASEAVEIPAVCFACGYLILTSDQAGNDAEPVVILRKA